MYVGTASCGVTADHRQCSARACSSGQVDNCANLETTSLVTPAAHECRSNPLFIPPPHRTTWKPPYGRCKSGPAPLHAPLPPRRHQSSTNLGTLSSFTWNLKLETVCCSASLICRSHGMDATDSEGKLNPNEKKAPAGTVYGLPAIAATASGISGIGDAWIARRQDC